MYVGHKSTFVNTLFRNQQKNKPTYSDELRIEFSLLNKIAYLVVKLNIW